MEQAKNLIKDHLEKHKFFDTIKSAVSKDPNLGKLDRNQIIEKLKTEGILGDIISTMPSKKQTGGMKGSADLSGSDSFGGNARASQATTKKNYKNLKALDPNKRHLCCNLVEARAFVDFVNPRDDEHISIAISFLKERYHSKHVRAACEMSFGDTFVFEFEGEHGNSKFDSSLMIQLNQPLHLTILRHRKNEKPVVIGTKNIDWRLLLSRNSIEVRPEIRPVDLTHQGSLGIIVLNLDLAPHMLKSELLGEE